MEMSATKPLVEFVKGESARIEIFAVNRKGRPVSPYLYGKFTEHLGRNIYNGMWAQVLHNTSFEPITYFDREGEKASERRLQRLEDSLKLSGLVESYKRGTAYEWACYGEGEVAYSLDSDRIHGDTSQKIVVQSLRSSEVGVQQPIYLPLHRTEDYELSLWLKGTVKNLHVSVYTIDGKSGSSEDGKLKNISALSPFSSSHLLGDAMISGLTETWQKYNLRFSIQQYEIAKEQIRGIAKGQLLMFALGMQETGTIWLDQCFLFPADHQKGFDPDVVRLLKESNLPLLRYPGGNFASGYHWKDGIGPVDKRPLRLNRDWNRDEPNHVGSDEFMDFCMLVGCEPLICVNAGDGTPEEAADWVEYCNGSIDTEYGSLRAENGHPEPYGMKFWEVGNELYGSWQIGHCTPEEYAKRYDQFYQAMIARDPNILFIANGQNAEWNAPIIQQKAAILRNLSIHTLIGGRMPDETPPEDVFRSIMAYPLWYESHLRTLGEQMSNGGVTPKLAITELQIFTNKPHLPNNSTLSEALFWTGIVNTAIRLGDLVELITHTALVNHGGGLRKDREIVYPNPVHWACHLYATQSGRWPISLRVSCPHFSVTQLHNLPAVENAPYLDAIALLDDSGSELNLLVTNRHVTEALTVEIALHDFPSQPEVLVQTLASASSPSYMAQNSWERPDEVKLRESKIRIEVRAQHAMPLLNYTFPACSLTSLRFRRRA